MKDLPLTLLQKRRRFYEAILELALLERSSIQQDCFHEIHQLLTQKKILLNCIEEIDRELAPFQQFFTPPLEESIAKELVATKKVINDLLRLDSLNQRVLGHGEKSSKKQLPSKNNRGAQSPR
jgi:hypothetical protein